MKTSKASAAFLTKFSSILPKLKQSSTIPVAHDQIRKLFSQYRFPQIALCFASKMDSCDQLNEKQKREYIKIYISLIDVYGQDIVLEYYERILESLARKGVGVAEVVGHLCRTLLKRIYPKENIANYIRHLMIVFQRHIEIGKILKQIVQSFEPQIIAPFQSQITNLISQKLSSSQKPQSKSQLLEATLATILALESKFYEEATVQPFVQKNFKNEDWNVRKLCVDITYALLVINQSAIRVLHQAVLELRYDKIKHVRDAVGNYVNLYRQVYGEEEKEKEKQKEKEKEKERVSITGLTGGSIRSQQDLTKRTVTSKSPAITAKFKTVIEPEPKKSSSSLEKSIKNASRNQGFFQNAGNKDVIKLPESKSVVFPKQSLPQQKRKDPPQISQNYIVQKQPLAGSKKNAQKIQTQPQTQINFQQYLKNRPHQQSYFNFSPTQKQERNKNYPQEKIETMYNPLESFSGRPEDGELGDRDKEEEEEEGEKIVDSKLIDEGEEDGKVELMRRDMRSIEARLEKFTSEVLTRLKNLQRRVLNLEETRGRNQSISEVSLSSLQKDIKQMKCQIADGYLQQSFQQRFNEIPKDKKFYKKQQQIPNKKVQERPNRVSPAFQSSIESNLSSKIKQSLKENNWDEAFSLAIANNSKNALMQLLEYEEIPKDKLVQDCLFVELRRNLGTLVVLKWLTYFIQEVEVPLDKLRKLQSDLERAEQKFEGTENLQSESRNYQMVKSILQNEIRSKLEQK